MINYQKWLAAANGIQLTSWEALKAGIVSTTKAMGIWLATTPAGWATMAGVAIAGVVLGVNAYNKKQEELREAAIESANEIDNQSKSLDELKQKYIEICDSTDDEKTKNEKLNEIKQELIDVYGFEKDALKELNDERERGLGLLDGEFEKKNRNARNNWLEDNKDSIKKANEEMASDGVDYFTTYLSKNNIASSILELFDKQEAFGDTGYVSLEFDYTDTADRLNKLKNIYNEILDVQSKRSLTADEEQLLSDVKTTLDSVQGVYDKYYDIYSKAAKYNVENIVENYLNTDEGKIENVGKDTFKSWSKGLLDQAENAEQKRQLENYIEEAFPDLTKYFENLAKARQKFAQPLSANQYEVAWAKEKDAFLESLSPEDLEAALNIPDLFADGLDGAKKEIAKFKADPNNKISIESDTKSMEDMLKVVEDYSKSASTYSKSQKTISDALEEQVKYGKLASDTVIELTDAGYASALVYDDETGAITLNRQAVENLNTQKQLELKLDLIKEKSEIEQKYKDETTAIADMQREMATANETRREEIRLSIAQKSANASEYREMIAQYDGLLNAIGNYNPSATDTSEEPESITKFKKALAKKEYLLNTNQISEQDYYEWLDSESKRVYGNLADYEEDRWKYEEQVYKWRQEQEQDLFDKKIENLKKLSDNALDKYVDGNGNELTVNASFDYAREQIYTAIEETQNRINELSLKTGFEDEIEELTSDLEDLYDTLDDINKKEIESQKDYINELKDNYSDSMDEIIDKQKELADTIDKAYENQIDAIDKQINAIEKKNEAEKRQNDILEARKKLEEAKREDAKNAYVSFNGTGFTIHQTTEAQDEAQADLDEAKQNEQIAKLEEQKEILETQRDNSKDYYDKVVEDLESQKEAREKQYDILVGIYEQLGGEKKQASLNESLVNKLTKNGDINKAVQGLTPTELQQAFTSGILTTDSDGNYAIDYSVLGKNEDAVNKNTAELEKLNSQLSGETNTDTSKVDMTKPHLDSEGYLVGTNGKRVLHDGKGIKATTKAEWEKKKTPYAGFETMTDLFTAIQNGSFNLPNSWSYANQTMNSNIMNNIGKDIKQVPEYVANNVTNNNAPNINFTVNVEGSADQKTVRAMEEKITAKLVEYTDAVTNTFKRKYSSI